jgi:hypothetical protein
MSCVGNIEEKVGKVMPQYATTPNITVLRAFRFALRSRRCAASLSSRRNFTAS